MRQEVYRVAYDEAKAELGEILGKFEALRLKKDRIEKVVDALKPLVAAESQAGSSERPVVAAERPLEFVPSEPTHHAPDPVPQAVQQAVDSSSDPFQRRVDNAIGLGSTAKDVREYSRLFNGGGSR